MESKQNILLMVIGYFLAIFVSVIGLIYGAIIYFAKKDDSEFYYEHSRNIMAVSIVFIILRLFASFGGLINLGL